MDNRCRDFCIHIQGGMYMPDIGLKPGDGWDRGRNLDSKLEWADHVRIVEDALALLKGEKYDKHEILHALQKVNQGKKINLSITKGVHDRKRDPHIQLQLDMDKRLIHLNLISVPEGTKPSFRWVGVQFTVADGKTYRWPNSEMSKNPIEHRSIIERRGSISDAKNNAAAAASSSSAVAAYSAVAASSAAGSS